MFVRAQHNRTDVLEKGNSGSDVSEAFRRTGWLTAPGRTPVRSSW